MKKIDFKEYLAPSVIISTISPEGLICSSFPTDDFSEGYGEEDGLW